MRRFGLVAAALFAHVALAQCPPACTGGGGPASTDCFLVFGGATGSSGTCTDGDPTCDLDGAKDGVCTLALTACTGTALGACAATPLDGPPRATSKGAGAEALVAAIGALSPTGPACTAPGLVRLAIATSPTKLKPAKVRVKTTAVAGGKTDRDTIRLACEPARPSYAADLEPLFTQNCTFTGCHSAALPQSGLSLEAGQGYAGLVGQKALAAPRLLRVKPGSLRASFLTRSVLGLRTRQMPDGCPAVLPPVERCLEPAEQYRILAWIQAGARP
jgi:hypothetical protein